VATLILLAAMLVLLWALLIRPQRRKQFEQRQLLASIEPGDEVLTVGGIYGIVHEVDVEEDDEPGEDDDLIVEIAEGIRVRMARRAVAGVVKPDDELEEGDEAPLDDRAEAAHDADDEDNVVVSEEIVKTEVTEGAEALDRR
jgi:preprotein translocase subunit YajC